MSKKNTPMMPLPSYVISLSSWAQDQKYGAFLAKKNTSMIPLPSYIIGLSSWAQDQNFGVLGIPK